MSWLERGLQNSPVLDANCFIHSLPFDPLRRYMKKTLAESVLGKLVSGTNIVRIFNKARVKKMINNEWYAAEGKQKTRYPKQLSVKPQPSQKRTGMMAEVGSEVTSYDMQGSTQ